MTRRLRIVLLSAATSTILLLGFLAFVPAVALVGAGGSPRRDPDPSLDALRRERAFLTGRLAAASDPLIGISVDAGAGTISVELAGVPLRTVTAGKVSIPWAIRSAAPDSVMLTRLVDRTGLIPPEPVRRVEAPADTAEANRAPATVPVETTPAAVNLILENGIVIRLDPDSSSGIVVPWYRLTERIRDNTRSVVDAIAAREPRIRGELRMRMTDADAKAVYRALTNGSPVVLKTGPGY